MALVFMSSFPTLAQDCTKKAETYANAKVAKQCKTKKCKTVSIDQTTDSESLTSSGVKADEQEYMVTKEVDDGSTRPFTVVLKKNDCKKVSVDEIGSSDD